MLLRCIDCKLLHFLPHLPCSPFSTLGFFANFVFSSSFCSFLSFFTTLVDLLLIFSYQATTAPGPDDDVVIRVKSYIGESFLSPRITIVQQINDILQTLAPAREFHRALAVAIPRSPTTRSSPTMAGGSLSPTRWDFILVLVTVIVVPDQDKLTLLTIIWI